MDLLVRATWFHFLDLKNLLAFNSRYYLGLEDSSRKGVSDATLRLHPMHLSVVLGRDHLDPIQKLSELFEMNNA
jgi:hypothetical protein